MSVETVVQQFTVNFTFKEEVTSVVSVQQFMVPSLAQTRTEEETQTRRQPLPLRWTSSMTSTSPSMTECTLRTAT